MYKFKHYNKKVKYKKIILTFLVVILFTSVSIVFFQKSIEEKDIQILSFQDSGKVDYKIKLKPNQFYKEEYLKNDMSYLSSLIDNIEINFDYKLYFNNPINYSFIYCVNSILYIVDKNSKNESDSIIYSNSEELINSRKQTATSSYINIQQPIIINYEQYNSFVKAFAQENGFAPSCYLVVELSVGTSGVYQNIKDINKKATMNIKIPLYDKIIDIDETNSTLAENGEFIDSKINTSFLIIAILLALLALILLILISKWIYDIIPRPTKYQAELNKIFKKYDQIIVKSIEQIELNGMEIINVKNFEDLVNASDILHEPIRYFEKTKNEKKESFFIIKSKKECYRLSLNETKL